MPEFSPRTWRESKAWRRVTQWTALILGIAASVATLADTLAKRFDWPLPKIFPFGSTEFGILLIVIFASVWAATRFPRIRTKLVRLILGPPKLPLETPLLFRGLQPYRAGEHLPGRQAEGEACWLLLQQYPFVVLEGESGCGKSSLLNAVLMPKAEELFRTVRVRAGDAPYKNTIQALSKLAEDFTDWPADPQGLAKAISALAVERSNKEQSPEKGKPLLICIDQFEELFGSVNARVRTGFLETLRNAIEADQLRLLIVIRVDFSDLLLNLCREVDPKGTTLDLGNFYTLKPFQESEALGVLHEMFLPISSANKQLEQELNMFAEALVDDLLQPSRDRRLPLDNWTVLPAELQIVGQMIESLGVHHFTASNFRKHGGRNGLLIAYIEQAKTYVSRKTAVPGEKALLILRQLIPQTKTRSAQSPRPISQALGLSVSQVVAVLEAFADLKLVNRLPAQSVAKEGDADAAALYELMHEHLAQILQEAPEVQKAKELEERLRFWHQRGRPPAASREPSERFHLTTRVKSAFSQPVPFAEILRLLPRARSSADRRMLLRSLRAFALKCAVITTVLATVLIVIVLRQLTDAYQIRAIVADAPFVDPGEASDPVRISWQLDDWAEILSKSGYAREAREDVQQALRLLEKRDKVGVDIEYIDTASVILERQESRTTFCKRGAARGHENSGKRPEGSRSCRIIRLGILRLCPSRRSLCDDGTD